MAYAVASEIIGAALVAASAIDFAVADTGMILNY